MASAPIVGSEIRYLFIDGGCLRASLQDISKRYAGGRELTLDFDSFTQQYSKVFYYDAMPARLDGESDQDYNKRHEEQIAYIEAIRQKDRFHVYEGDVRRARSRREKPEQKKVDVLIAVDMLAHSFKRNMHRATLLTSDSDFVPLIDALVKEGMFVTLWYPPRDTNIDLIAAADGKIPLRVDAIYDHLSSADKEAFQIPQVTTEPGRGDFAPVQREWEEFPGTRLRICEFAGKFTAERLDLEKQIATYASHTDRNLLENFVQDIWLVRLPETPQEEPAAPQEEEPAAAQDESATPEEGAVTE